MRVCLRACVCACGVRVLRAGIGEAGAATAVRCVLDQLAHPRKHLGNLAANGGALLRRAALVAVWPLLYSPDACGLPRQHLR